MATQPGNKADLIKRVRVTRDARSTARGVPTDTDIRVTGAELYLLPVRTRVPLKFGPETLTSVTCARVRIQVTDQQGRSAWGWGETPLNVQWAWPGDLGYQARHDAMIEFCKRIVPAIVKLDAWGHPIEVGYSILETFLPVLLRHFNEDCGPKGSMPLLAALVCVSPFDIALHDAYGMLHGVPTYETYQQPWMNSDLSHYLEPGEGTDVDFRGKYPQEFFDEPPHSQLAAWHLVGGLDLLDRAEVNGEPHDALPVLLDDWITRDGLTCLKIKLRGNDAAWDYDRIVRIGRIALARGVQFLSTDFNCMVTEVSYVTDILDRLAKEVPAIYDLILYIEQPFPYELEQHPTDVRSRLCPQAAVHGRERARLETSSLGSGARLDGRGVENVQDADRRVAFALLGESPWHGRDGSGPHQSDARADSARAPRVVRGHGDGRRDQCDAVLSAGVGAGGRDSFGPLCTVWRAD